MYMCVCVHVCMCACVHVCVCVCVCVLCTCVCGGGKCTYSIDRYVNGKKTHTKGARQLYHSHGISMGT